MHRGKRIIETRDRLGMEKEICKRGHIKMRNVLKQWQHKQKKNDIQKNSPSRRAQAVSKAKLSISIFRKPAK